MDAQGFIQLFFNSSTAFCPQQVYELSKYSYPNPVPGRVNIIAVFEISHVQKLMY